MEEARMEEARMAEARMEVKVMVLAAVDIPEALEWVAALVSLEWVASKKI